MTNRAHLMTFLVVLALAALAQAQTFTVLYNFADGSDGGDPFAGVIQDAAGNLYGTTYYGGELSCAGIGCGVVYELGTAGTETVLHTFTGSPDGASTVTPVVRDRVGNVYGTTTYGGATDNGTVFEIDTAGKETVLYSFTGRSDGCLPLQGLIGDSDGNLYGTTWACGSSGFGTIFKVNSAGKFTLLYSFAGDAADPEYGHLTMDRSGTLYGVTEQGGANRVGALYRLGQNGMFTVLHSFRRDTLDGCYPAGSVVQDKAGNLYGTTFGCGRNYRGTIWRVNKNGKETILHNFDGASGGCKPWAGLARDSKGNLYGVTYGCGANHYGVLYKLSASRDFTLLHTFGSSDGTNPIGEVLRTAHGTLLGTTPFGGAYGDGTVWSYVP